MLCAAGGRDFKNLEGFSTFDTGDGEHSPAAERKNYLRRLYHRRGPGRDMGPLTHVGVALDRRKQNALMAAP